MPSSKQNADLLQKMKDAGMLTEKITQAVEAAPTPSSPAYPNEPNPRLRTPMPASTVLGPDVERQFLNPAIPQVRMLPQTAAANPTVGAASASQAIAIAPAVVAADLDLIGINEQSGTSYTVNESDLDTIISMSNNAGGTITLPANTSGSISFLQVATGGNLSWTGGVTRNLNYTSNVANHSTLVVYVVSDNYSGGAPTFTVTDSLNGAYTQVGTYVNVTRPGPANCQFSVWIKANSAPGANTVSVTSSGSSIGGSTTIVEYTGNASVTPLVDSNAPGGGGVSTPSVTLTSKIANQMAVIFWMKDGGSDGTTSGPAGFTLRSGANPTIGGSGAQLWDDIIATPALATYGFTNTDVTVNSWAFGLILNAMSVSASNLFPKGWFTYIENTGSGTFSINPSGLTIDGSTANVSLGSNQGLLLIFDGTNWLTERGVGGGGGSTVGGTWNVISKTAIYTAIAGDMVIVDTTSGGFAITIPLAASNANKSIRVKKTSSDLNTVTVTPSGADLIDGMATQPFNGQETDMEITSDGVSNWWIA